MKFINYLTSITGVEVFPLISLLIFFVFFVALGYWVISADKTHIQKLKQIPLNNDELKNPQV